MPVARGRVELRGTLVSGVEAWSTGFYLDSLQGYSNAQCQTICDLVHNLWLTEMWDDATAGQYFPDTAHYVGAKVSDIGADNVTDRIFETTLSTPDAGQFGGNALPPQISPVCSLLTGTAGARGRGRMYLPVVGANATDSRGILLTDARDRLAAGMDQYFSAINAGSVLVTARTYSAADSQLRLITQVRVGSVLDTQRRRRDGIVEAYVTENVTT